MEDRKEDVRLDYIITLIKGIFPLSDSQIFLKAPNNDSVELFLNRLTCDMLTVTYINGTLVCTNKTPEGEGKHAVFLKKNGVHLTEENLGEMLSLHIVQGSPLNVMHTILKGLLVPLMLSEDAAPQLQDALSSFDTSLTRVLFAKDKSTNVVCNVGDEIGFWQLMVDAPQSRADREAGKAFLEILHPISQDLSSLQTGDVEELVDSILSRLDELWRLEGHKYPHERMNRLLQVVGDAVTAEGQRRGTNVDVWRGDFVTVRDSLTTAASCCEQWQKGLSQMCTVYWGTGSERPWDSPVPQHSLCAQLGKRLRAVLQLRSIHHHLTRLLSSSEQRELGTAQLFDAFEGLKPVVWSPYTEAAWADAVVKFDGALVPAEQRVAAKLRSQLRHMNANTLQLLQELRRYQELLQRPGIASELTAERENLLSLLLEFINGIDLDAEDKLPMLDMPPVVSNIYWGRQFKAKICDVVEMNESCLSELKGSSELKQKAEEMLKNLQRYENEELDSWAREIHRGIKDHSLALSDDSPVLRMEGRMVEVTFSPRLPRLVREVKQLSVLELKIPPKIRELYERAVLLMKKANTLEQIAHFHNTIGDRMIPSQRPMMLTAAQTLENLITTQNHVTWSEPEQVDAYIQKLQVATEGLSRQNNTLAFHHGQIRQKVAELMDTDLVRQQGGWKAGLRDIRETINKVEEMGFSNMKSWRTHWDYQLYKVLEKQYQLGLTSLHSNLPEIKTELVYRQQRLQFQPPLEELKMKYYGQVKRFLSIPKTFKGVSETSTLFATIIERNARRFGDAYVEAERVFSQLENVVQLWQPRVVLGGVSLDQMANESLENSEDWDFNFRASKNQGQEVAKLRYEDVKVGCITVSLLNMRTEMELQNRRYWDALSLSLQSAILRRCRNVSDYIEQSMLNLAAPRQSMEHVAEAYTLHAKILESSEEKRRTLEETVKMNKTLASWTKEKMDVVASTAGQWDQFTSQLTNFEALISRQVESMKLAVQGEAENLLAEAERFKFRFDQIRLRDVEVQGAGVDVMERQFKLVSEKMLEWKTIQETQEKLKKDFEQFGLTPPDLSLVSQVDEELQSACSAWSLYGSFSEELAKLSAEEWIIFRTKTYKLEEWLSDWEKKAEAEASSTLAVRLLQEIQTFQRAAPLLKYLRGETFSDRHWAELLAMLDVPHKPPESLVLADFLQAKDKIVESEEKLQELNSRALSEVAIRQALSELDSWEVTARLSLAPHTDSRNTELRIVKELDDVVTKLADQQALVQSVVRSGAAGSFADRVEALERKLQLIEDCVKTLSSVQRKWLYLEPVFVNGSLKIELGRFQRADQDVRKVLADILKDNHVVALARIPNLKNMLTTCLDQLNRCQASLNQYLQEKRSKFPRFYFLSDDDLLELLGQAAKEQVIQAHLKKLFSGVHSVVVEDGKITTISSLQGEKVSLQHPVTVTNDVEDWLIRLNLEIKSTLQSLFETRMNDNDPSKYPSQILCLAEYVWFTGKCEEAITKRTLKDFLATIKEKLAQYSGADVDWKENPVLALKLKALLIDVVYFIDVVEILISRGVTRVSDWLWQKQLRFYVDNGGTTVARMADAELAYTYEYQGNSAKLVRTPLTERCFLTLTQALRMGLGGNPYGPAGTGKTESVKALGGLLGRQVLVFNCDEGIDVESMGRIFIGLVQCGAWGCFDEFNRLEESTLSAVSMLIQPILAALRERKSSVQLLGKQVELDGNSGLFVTLNPAGRGYGGRQKLPANLKALFRPVVMSAPDDLLISQVSLLCDGFENANKVGRKLVELLDFCRHTLSRQGHYDWGLRALKTILGSCASLLRARRASGVDVSKDDELSIAVQAARVNTLSKLTATDAKIFDSLLQDIFPGVAVSESGFSELTSALADSFSDLKLQQSDIQVKKCLELWQQMQERMGVALVGPSSTGKSTLIRLLRHALIKMGVAVEIRTLNPKAMPRSQLLGHVDLDTRQWSDGVLTSCAGQLAALPNDTLAWLICDGDVDPEWVESLNSVLDDNRLLTLPSGWRIQFGPNVNFVFETGDLAHASPATISRMGTIFISEAAVTPGMVIQSWLTEQDANTQMLVAPFVETVIPTCVECVARGGGVVVPQSAISFTKSALSHLSGVQSQPEFVVGLIRGLSANLELTARQQLAQKVFQEVGEYLPDPSRVVDVYYDSTRQRIEVYHQDSSPAVADTGLVLSAAAQTDTSVLQRWLDAWLPVVVCGPPGGGKGILIRHCVDQLTGAVLAVVAVSATTRPHHILYKLRQVCHIATNASGRIYRPSSANRVILYLKYLELAAPDRYGSNELLAWLQQLLGLGGFYDADHEWTTLDRIQVLASLGNAAKSPGQRVIANMHVLHVAPPDSFDLRVIHNPLLKNIVTSKNLPSDLSQNSKLLDTILGVFTQVQSRFHGRCQHYHFSSRDLTKWINGVNRYAISDKTSLLTSIISESFRILGDRLIPNDLIEFTKIMDSSFGKDWNASDLIATAKEGYFVTENVGEMLCNVEERDWSEMVRKAGLVVNSGADDVIITKELLRLVASVDHSISMVPGNCVLIGRSGVGRKSAARIVAAIHNARLLTLTPAQNYSLKNLKSDLKPAVQASGVDGQSVVLLVDGAEISDQLHLQLVTALLTTGEVLGLLSPDELDAMVAPLIDIVAQEGHSLSNIAFFAQRVLKYLHVVLVLDHDDVRFTEFLERNPSLINRCDVVYSSDWSVSTLADITRSHLTSLPTFSEVDELIPLFAEIGSSITNGHDTPRRFNACVETFILMYDMKRREMMDFIEMLRAGITKLTEAQTIVDKLKLVAAEQEEKLAEKKDKAAAALDEISETMRSANTRKEEMQDLKERTVRESGVLKERQKDIEVELAEVEPLVEEARQAVGGIKSEALAEIRSMRAPPEAVRDILEGVLRLMGIRDTSWNSMKTFLAKRGVKEEIRTFDAHRISTDSREAGEAVLAAHAGSFDARVAKRASAAAAPLASWVVANIQYAKVLEKIRPLEKEQAALEQNLKAAESQVGALSSGLGEVDKKVAELKEQLNNYSREAAVIEINLTRERETVVAAESLLSRLEEEYSSWRQQLKELSDNLTNLPRSILLSSAFITYLGPLHLDERNMLLKKWYQVCNLPDFNMLHYLSSEQQTLRLVAQGLPADSLSVSNSIIVLNSWLPPLLVDPEGIALNWLSQHFKERDVDIVPASSPRLGRNIELAVRFGKVLIVTEIVTIPALLSSALRHHVLSVGTRQVLWVGDGLIDCHDDFRLFLITRREETIPSFNANLVNFTTTEDGLAAQLLTSAIEQERPELGNQRSTLLRDQEELKSKLRDLQEQLLRELGSAQGDILKNEDLLTSLEKTRSSSQEIAIALEKAKALEHQLNEQCAVFKPIVDFAAHSYMVLPSLTNICNLYAFSISAFKNVFLSCLKEDSSSLETQKQGLIKMVYHFISRSLFKSDRLVCALHLLKHCFPQTGTEQEWQVLLGDAAASSQQVSLPSWAEEDRLADIGILEHTLPSLYSSLELSGPQWKDFATSGHCEENLPVRLTPLQCVIVVQAFRPDRLHASLSRCAAQLLGMQSLSTSATSLHRLISDPSSKEEPILLLVSGGADPSEEVRQAALTANAILFELALGQGQTSSAVSHIQSSASTGSWLMLKNLHLAIDWLSELEQSWHGLQKHESFRLILITEPHQKFPYTLASMCRKVAIEAPPGVKKNIERTYNSWPSDALRGRGVSFAQLLFSAAWLHAVIQERRKFIPQGWLRWYEFTDADLAVVVDLLHRVVNAGSSTVPWDWIRGLVQDAVYGGRVESMWDHQVLGVYLRELLSDKAPMLHLPNSDILGDYLQVIHDLPDQDTPALFGLAENIERSWQKTTGEGVILQLKGLESRHATKSTGLNSENYQELSPILSLWKTVHQGLSLLQMKIPDRSNLDLDPVGGCVLNQLILGLGVIQTVHKGLAAISKGIRGAAIRDGAVARVAQSLLLQETPAEWQALWRGPEDPRKYLRAIVNKTAGLHKFQQSQSLLNDVDLAFFLYPEAFIKSVKQLTARNMNVAPDELIATCSWNQRGQREASSCRLINLQVEGCRFENGKFVHTVELSPSLASAPPAYLSYVPKTRGDENSAVLPLYKTSDREELLIHLPVTCVGPYEEWIKTGAAFFCAY